MTTKAKSKVTQAYELAAPIRIELGKLGRCMEVTEDKAGILWERWIIHNKRSVILVATPRWADVFVPLSDDLTWNGTIEALKKHAEE